MAFRDRLFATLRAINLTMLSLMAPRSGMPDPRPERERRSAMSADLERRLRQLRSRVAVRAWEYRQRNHAKGAWMRLRRVLAEAQSAYVISPGDAEQLLAEGYTPHPVGRELEPTKVIVFLSGERASRMPGAEEIPVRLDAGLLEASALALVAFP